MVLLFLLCVQHNIMQGDYGGIPFSLWSWLGDFQSNNNNDNETSQATHKNQNHAAEVL